MPLILPGNVASALGGAFEVANSCRFNDDDSPSLYHDGSSSTAVQKATISFWVKRCKLGASQYPFYCGDTSAYGDRNFYIKFHSDDRMYVRNENSATVLDFITTRKFRDVGAWMNVVVKLDLTESGTDRCKLYINGTEETAFDTQTSGTIPEWWTGKTGYRQWIAYSPGEDCYGDFYLAECVLIDGLALAPTSFGEFDEDSPTIWKPKDVSGLTFGTNGFYLDYEDSGDLGDDESGNTNDFTEGNLAAVDQCSDSPTNNFCTMNPLDNYHQVATFSEGNCKVVTNADKESFLTGTMGVSSGKWYYEVKCVTASTQDQIGFTDTPSNAYNDVMQNTTNGRKGFVYRDHSNVGAFRVDGGTQITTNYDDWTDGDVLGVYIDLDNLEAYVSKNGTLQNSGTGQTITAASSAKGFYLPAIGDEASDSFTAEVNFGNPVSALSSAVADANGYGQFEYSPSGTFDGASKDFLAICTKNLGSDGG